MKTKYLLFLLLLLCFRSIDSQAQGMEFFTGSLEEAKAKAAAENKLLFIDFYADWCVPCKMMAKEVFTDSTVGAYYNQKFINLQLNVEKPENQKWVKQYKVTSMPTLAILKADGKMVSLSAGARNKENFLKLGRMATGEELSFEKMYARCKSADNDEIVKKTLKAAPDFVGSLEGIEAQKWISRINKLYKDYITRKLREDNGTLINAEDYQISLRFHQIVKDDPLLEYINKNLPAYRTKLGNAPAAWVIEYNNKITEDLAKAGDMAYQEYLERIKGDMQAAYAISPQTEISVYDRQKSYCDGLYILYHDKDATRYIEHINRYLAALGKEADATAYGQAAQNMYYAIQGRLLPEQHQAAIEWNIKALQFKNVPLMDRINLLTMMGDSYKALKDYKKAEEAYNQAYMESLQIEGEMTSMGIQMAIKRKLSALELLK